MKHKVNIDLWMNRIERCRKAQKSYNDIWQDNIRKMNHLFTNYSGEPRHIVVNLVYSFVKTVIPSVFFQNPYVIATPNNRTAAGGMIVGQSEAEMAEALVNYYFEEFGWGKVIKRIIWDALVMSHGVASVGVYGEVVPIFSPVETRLYHNRDKSSKLSIPATANLTAIPTRFIPEKKVGTTDFKNNHSMTYEFSETVRIREPYLRRVSPYNLFIDPDCTTLDESPYVIERSIRSVRDIKANPIYENTADLHGTLSEDPWDKASPDSGNGSFDPDRERVELYSIHDKRTRMFYVFAGGHSKPLRIVENPYFKVIGGFPYRILTFDENPEQFYGMPPINAFSGIQDAIHMVVSKITNKIDRMKTVIVVDSTIGNVDEFIRDLRKAKDLGIIQSQNVQGVKIIEDTAPSEAYYNYVDKLEALLHKVTGISDYHKGFSMEARTATEASIIDASYSLKMEEKIHSVEEFISDLSRMVVQVSKKYSDPVSLIPVMGVDGAITWRKLGENSRWLKGEYTFRVDAKSSTPMSRKRRAENARDILSLIGDLPEVNRTELIRRVLRACEIRAEERILKTETNTEDHDPAVMENLLILKNRPVEVQGNENHEHHLRIHTQLIADHPDISKNPDALILLAHHIVNHRTRLEDIPFGTNSGVQP